MIHNFNAGPSVLPKEVFEEASRAIIDFNNTGLSILEIGHRTPLFEDVLNEAISLEEVLRGMTIWAAFASFQENKLGSLEKGKDATFVIFERKVQSQLKFQQNYSWRTFVKGLIVYDANEL